ncbi:MAG: HIT domain-containing protein [Bryobacterales bacterium]|nr:HIT domain-containing protein [Acidobacteriota bacterium]MCB9384666.1 HIT domain-containing protein [Bryobacterales bacterium]
MDHIFSPWRFQYLASAAKPAQGECVFCKIAASDEDESEHVVYRGERNYIVLNRYPYTNGHAMVIPYEHMARLDDAPVETVEEMMRLTQRLETCLHKLYQPDGVNVGMNIGRAAGAGVAGHIHMHVLPRWFADANFMTVIAETRIVPEELGVTWRRMRDALEV